jgi:hypothetical protein
MPQEEPAVEEFMWLRLVMMSIGILIILIRALLDPINWRVVKLPSRTRRPPRRDRRQAPARPAASKRTEAADVTEPQETMAQAGY